MIIAVSLFVKQQSKQKFWMNESKFLNINVILHLPECKCCKPIGLSENSSNSTLSEFITQHFILILLFVLRFANFIDRLAVDCLIIFLQIKYENLLNGTQLIESRLVIFYSVW